MVRFANDPSGLLIRVNAVPKISVKPLFYRRFLCFSSVERAARRRRGQREELLLNRTYVDPMIELRIKFDEILLRHLEFIFRIDFMWKYYWITKYVVFSGCDGETCIYAIEFTIRTISLQSYTILPSYFSLYSRLSAHTLRVSRMRVCNHKELMQKACVVWIDGRQIMCLSHFFHN